MASSLLSPPFCTARRLHLLRVNGGLISFGLDWLVRARGASAP